MKDVYAQKCIATQQFDCVEKILDAQIHLLFGQKDQSSLSLQCGDKIQEIMLEELDTMQLQNVRYLLEKESDALKAEIFFEQPLCDLEPTWERYRELNRKLDFIVNRLACHDND